ncbi:hypothetical protein [Photobacterium sp. 1_MG-2023]|uniref:hypothetical protein n=1 Tax=Photobacterium sp. 1_MG-2023 TaxID=3062646 RepID=UPI0026E2476E|nr:hypothetical protein [Photobacterium sp. 1_MG-2023]MDO6706771.1 hypothetical protein [Photobacterium sp. 1_MG-2023]
MGGMYGGAIGGKLAVAGTVLVLGVVGVTSAPVIAIASLAAFVVGGAVGGIAGAAGGKSFGDFIYETTIDFTESVEEVMKVVF